MKMTDFIKNLILGFWEKGFIQLCKIVSEHWIISLLIIILIVYLCSDAETAIYAWLLIGVFAIYSAIKAFIEIFVQIRLYKKAQSQQEKTLIIKITGGKIFDLILCIVGVFQALRIFSHISKITKSTASAVNVVDDVASAVSKFLKDLK